MLHLIEWYPPKDNNCYLLVSFKEEFPRALEFLLKFIHEKLRGVVGSGKTCSLGISFLNNGSSSDIPKSFLCFAVRVTVCKLNIAMVYLIK